MINKILSLLELNSTEWFDKFIPQETMTFFLTSGNDLKHGTINVIVFEKRSPFPFAVAKIARSKIGTNSLKAEYNNLLNISSNRSLINRIPHVYCLEHIDNNVFLIESFLRGELISNQFNNLFIARGLNKDASNILELVFSWITEIHHGDSREVLAGNFANPDELKIKGIDPASPIKLGLIHGDFWAGNILVDDSNLNIIDWEFAEFDVPLIWDVFFFSLTFARHILEVKGSKYDESDLIYFLKNDDYWALKLLREFINKYLNDFNIYWPLADYLLREYLIKLSQRDYKMYGEASGGDFFWKSVLIKSFNLTSG